MIQDETRMDQKPEEVQISFSLYFKRKHEREIFEQDGSTRTRRSLRTCRPRGTKPGQMKDGRKHKTKKTVNSRITIVGRSYM